VLDRIVPMFDHGGSIVRKPENDLMSLADNASRPLPVLTKLVVVLQFVFAKCVSLLRSGKASGELPVSKFLGEAPGLTRDQDRVDLQVAGSKLSHKTVVAEPMVIAEPKPDDRCDREALIRRRWIETGIKMWNPDHHGTGRAALNIQGRAGLLPVKPSELLAAYDTLEFRLIDGRIVCEDVVVDPPQRRK